MKSERPYQTKCKEAVLDAEQRGVSSMLFVLPTSCGKTFTTCRIDEGLRERGYGQSVVVMHTYELLMQWQKAFRENAPHLKVSIDAGRDHKGNYRSDVILTTVQTMRSANRMPGLAPDKVYIDEAHHAIPGSGYDKVLQKLKPRLAIFMTATDYRLDRKALHSVDGSLIDECVFTYPLKRARKEGWTCRTPYERVNSHQVLDDNMRVSMGDFNQEDLAFKVDNIERTERAFIRWEQKASDRKSIGFCVNVAHAKHACEYWNMAGYTAEYVHGEMNRDVRKDIFKRFETGEVQVLFNCMIATEGFDAQDIRCVILLRPTVSWSLYSQMYGRGVRILEGPQIMPYGSWSGEKDCIIIDVVDICTKMSPATLPAILGLPYDLELKDEEDMEAEPEDVFEAADKADKIAAAVKSKPPRTYKELVLMCEQVDILNSIKTPAEIEKLTRFKWLKTGTGFVLYSGRDQIQMIEDAIGDYHLSHAQTSRRLSGDLVAAFRQADKYVKDTLKADLKLLDRNVKWNGKQITDSQIETLRKLRVDEATIKTLDRGTASNLISAKFASKSPR